MLITIAVMKEDRGEIDGPCTATPNNPAISTRRRDEQVIRGQCRVPKCILDRGRGRAREGDERGYGQYNAVFPARYINTFLSC